MLKAIHVFLVLSALAILAYPAAVAVDSAYGQDVYLLASVHADEDVATNRELFELTFDPEQGDDTRREEVLAIYGNVAKLETERVLVFDPERTAHPEEYPEIAWLPAGSAGGEYPIQAETVAYTTQRVTLGGFLAAAILLGLRFVLARRARTEHGSIA